MSIHSSALQGRGVKGPTVNTGGSGGSVTPGDLNTLLPYGWLYIPASAFALAENEGDATATFETIQIPTTNKARQVWRFPTGDDNFIDFFWPINVPAIDWAAPTFLLKYWGTRDAASSNGNDPLLGIETAVASVSDDETAAATDFGTRTTFDASHRSQWDLWGTGDGSSVNAVVVPAPNQAYKDVARNQDINGITFRFSRQGTTESPASNIDFLLYGIGIQWDWDWATATPGWTT